MLLNEEIPLFNYSSQSLFWLHYIYMHNVTALAVCMLADLLTVIMVTISFSLSLTIVEISLYEMHRKPHEVIIDDSLIAVSP